MFFCPIFIANQATCFNLKSITSQYSSKQENLPSIVSLPNIKSTTFFLNRKNQYIYGQYLTSIVKPPTFHLLGQHFNFINFHVRLLYHVLTWPRAHFYPCL